MAAFDIKLRRLANRRSSIRDSNPEKKKKKRILHSARLRERERERKYVDDDSRALSNSDSAAYVRGCAVQMSCGTMEKKAKRNLCSRGRTTCSRPDFITSLDVMSVR
jgi:hypothetical protein